MTVDKLLILLDDTTVKNKIKSIFSDAGGYKNLHVEECGEGEVDIRSDAFIREQQALEKDNAALNKEKDEMLERIKNLLDKVLGKDKELSSNTTKIEELDFKIDNLSQSFTDKETEVNKLLKEIERLKVRLDGADKKADWYRENFTDDIKVQAIYSDLSEVTKKSLSGVFKNTTLVGLIACGIQEKNIGNLWDYTKNELVNGTNPDINNLIQLFDILFSRFRLAFPVYESQSVVEGDDFDTQLHIKHNSSSCVSGAIEAVLLSGYWNVKTDKIVKQSIVRIR